MTKNSVRNDEDLAADEIGKILRNARVEAGFSIVQIAEMTRITKSHITALEANDFESLPAAPIYRALFAIIAKWWGWIPNRLLMPINKV